MRELNTPGYLNNIKYAKEGTRGTPNEFDKEQWKSK